MIRLQQKSAKHRYVGKIAPAPFQAPADDTRPAVGQRKRVKPRRAKLSPNPLKA